MDNPMNEVRVEKVTINVGCGRDIALLEKAYKLLEKLTGQKPIKTLSKKRIPTWNLRPGVPIGVKVTIRRKKRAEELLKNLLVGIDNKLKVKSFDDNGNFSFGIPEYISVPNLEYDHDLGLFGFEVCVTLEKKGFRVKRRRLKSFNPVKRKISKDVSINFVKNKYGVQILE
jgi:large subunit ribosomal protein L5